MQNRVECCLKDVDLSEFNLSIHLFLKFTWPLIALLVGRLQGPELGSMSQ